MLWNMRLEVDDVEEREHDEIENIYNDAEEEDQSQDQGPHSVQACGVKMHLHMSQEIFCSRIHR